MADRANAANAASAPIAYLHGFASSPQSRKGVWLREQLQPHGLLLRQPDLNVPDFPRLTTSGALTAIDAMDRGLITDTDTNTDTDADTDTAPARRWHFIGSSMGGYLASLWAARNPHRVRSMVLLCPGYDMARRWAALLGEGAMARWEADGALPFPDATGREVGLHWGFVEDGRALPPCPVPPCPTTIIHGTRDVQVPIDSSRAMAAAHAHIELLEVDDDHGLMGSLDVILDAVGAMVRREEQRREEQR